MSEIKVFENITGDKFAEVVTRMSGKNLNIAAEMDKNGSPGTITITSADGLDQICIRPPYGTVNVQHTKGEFEKMFEVVVNPASEVGRRLAKLGVPLKHTLMAPNSISDAHSWAITMAENVGEDIQRGNGDVYVVVTHEIERRGNGYKIVKSDRDTTELPF